MLRDVKQYQVVYLHFIRDHFRDPLVRQVFCDLMELRQRCYMPVNPKILLLDPLDLISTHVVLYHSASRRKILGAIRIVHSRLCAQYDQPFPIAKILEEASPQHFSKFQKFQERVGDAKQICYLCVDPLARHHTSQAPVSEALHWLSARWIKRAGETNFSGLINSRFNGQKWIKRFGDWPKFPEIQHPLVADPHEPFFIEKFAESYLAERALDFGVYYDQAIILDGENSGVTEERKAA